MGRFVKTYLEFYSIVAVVGLIKSKTRFVTGEIYTRLNKISVSEGLKTFECYIYRYYQLLISHII